MNPQRRRTDPGQGESWREVLSPEGVALRFALAGIGDRATAFMVDILIMVGLILAVDILLLLSMGSRFEEGWLLAFCMFAGFALRNFYFPWFELRRQGVTPGKRKVGLRVIRAEGGTLTADAVFARNLTREIEFWIPLVVLFAGGEIWPDMPAWMRAASAAWLLLCALIPFFNRDHLRLGDLAAGTLVVVAPKGALLPDLSGVTPVLSQADAAGFAFTNEQLDAYGIYELQVLEDVLRRRNAPGGDRAVAAVTRQIAKKIRWKGPRPSPPQAFLLAYYTALRARLERRMLFGKRKEDKHSTPDGP